MEQGFRLLQYSKSYSAEAAGGGAVEGIENWFAATARDLYLESCSSGLWEWNVGSWCSLKGGCRWLVARFSKLLIFSDLRSCRLAYYFLDT